MARVVEAPPALVQNINDDFQSSYQTSQDGTIRLWPIPDMNQPPLHTLPYEVLLERLRSFTNIRVVADEASSTGYRFEVGPFPGWEKVPVW